MEALFDNTPPLIGGQRASRAKDMDVARSIMMRTLLPWWSVIHHTASDVVCAFLQLIYLYIYQTCTTHSHIVHSARFFFSTQWAATFQTNQQALNWMNVIEAS